MKKNVQGKKIKRIARPNVRVDKSTYWCLSYLSEVMGIPVTQMINKELKNVMKDLNDGKSLTKPSANLKKNVYLIICRMPREVRTQVEIVKINQDLYDWTISDMVRIAARRVIVAHNNVFPEIRKITRRYNEIKEINNGELQEERENETGVQE